MDQDGFELVQSKPRRRIDGDSDIIVDGLEGAPPPLRHIWLSRIQKGSAESIKSFLESKDINVDKCVKVSHDEAKFSSFKISVEANDVEKVYAVNFWPKGVRCQSWKNKRNNDKDDNIVSDIDGTVSNEQDTSA